MGHRTLGREDIGGRPSWAISKTSGVMRKDCSSSPPAPAAPAPRITGSITLKRPDPIRLSTSYVSARVTSGVEVGGA
jgi:hypothetical protein